MVELLLLVACHGRRQGEEEVELLVPTPPYPGSTAKGAVQSRLAPYRFLELRVDLDQTNMPSPIRHTIAIAIAASEKKLPEQTGTSDG